jgi:hypothetical protein
MYHLILVEANPVTSNFKQSLVLSADTVKVVEAIAASP